MNQPITGKKYLDHIANKGNPWQKTVMYFARNAHRGQSRKYTGKPYVHHCAEVAELVAMYYPGVRPMEEAAWLHDTVEDTEVTLEDILLKFGLQTCYLVAALSDLFDPNIYGNRETRKALYRAQLRKSSWKARVIKCADIISNGQDILKHDEGFGKLYTNEALKTLHDMYESNDQTRPKLHSVAYHMLKVQQNRFNNYEE